MILKQKAQRLHDDAELAWHDGNEAEAERIDAIAWELEAENERRLIAAKARLESFDQEAQASGLLNAEDTSMSWSGDAPTFGEIGRRAAQMCEFWELAADSAQCIVDCRYADC